METFDIRKKDEKWKVVKEGSDRALRSFDKKKEAVSFGREHVRKEGGHLRIWSADGEKLQEERSYESVVTQKVRQEPEAMGEPARGLFEGIAKGASDAGKAAQQVLPVVGVYLNRGVYGTAYYAAYGVVLAAVTIGRAIPMPAPFARGLHEGTEAAIHTYEEGHAGMPHHAV